MDPESDSDASSLNLGTLLAYKHRGARSPSEEAGRQALCLKQAAANQLLYNREESANASDSESSNAVQVLWVNHNNAPTPGPQPPQTLTLTASSATQVMTLRQTSTPLTHQIPTSPRPLLPLTTLMARQRSRRVLLELNPPPPVTLDPAWTAPRNSRLDPITTATTPHQWCQQSRPVNLTVCQR